MAERAAGTVRPYAIGLTGGIASGKSTVAAAFAELDVPVLDADHAARAVLAPHSDGLHAVIARFGANLLRDDGSLDRAALRHIVFADTEARDALQAIVHPRVRILLAEQLRALDAPYAMLTIPLLRETWPAYAWLDRILVVDVPEAMQHARLLQRDGIDAALADAMLAAQAARAARIAVAHDVLDNSGPLDTLRERVSALHAQYLRLAGAR